MRVLFLQRQPCIRALKYAAALRARHRGITLGFAYQGRTLTEWYGAGDDLFTRWWRLPRSAPSSRLAAIVEDFAPDLIHSHNLPDLLTVLALEVSGGEVPVIHDVHDMQSLRRTPYEDGFDDPEDPLALEEAAVTGCDALVAVSQEMLDAITERYGALRRSLLFANYALAGDVAPPLAPEPEDGRTLRVVYQGSLSVNGSHYDLRDAFASIVAAGMSLDVYPNRDAPEYRALADRTPGMRLMETLPPAELMRVLPGYDVGWAAFNPGLNDAHLDTALPNKAFEYLASGLPVVSGPHRALAGLVRREGVGVVVDDPGEAPAALAAAGPERLRARVAERRGAFTVEGHIDALVGLYRDVVSASPVTAGRRVSGLE
ncbi:MAG: glycosyltransferase [Thermoleophilia bacterium]